MNRLRQYAKLPFYRRKLLRQAVLLVILARLLLWVLSLEKARRLLPRVARCLTPHPVSPELEIEIWAVKVAGYFVPRATCLVKALALHTLLERYGEPTQLQIGVTKDSNDQFLAHAWVQRDERVLIGGEESGRYTTLLSLN